jgi:hypothetical protein
MRTALPFCPLTYPLLAFNSPPVFQQGLFLLINLILLSKLPRINYQKDKSPENH